MDTTGSFDLLPATTEISLNGDHEKGTNGIGDNQENESSIEQDMSVETKEVPSPSISGGQTYIGSASVGSRLAGDDAIGSRLASSGVPPDMQSVTSDQSPVYKPNSSINFNKSKLAFGNSATPEPNSSKLSNLTLQEVQQVASVKAEQVKSWSVKTYKCTKQVLSEKLGRGTRTVDLELEAKVEILRDTKRKYENLLMLTKVLASHFSSIIQTQKVLGSAFAELSSKSQELQEELRYNAETQLVVAHNGENLLAAVNFFTSGVTTLCTKTMEDTLLTISKYESARLQYDAYRNELEAINLQPRTEANIRKQASAQANFSTHKSIYERLRDDVAVKLQFLNENRVKVMQKHLLLFHNAVTAYFAGNQQQLESALNQFNVKPTSGNSSAAWLEKK